jgi:hypothetical protein
MAIQGDLFDFSLTDLLWFLDNRQKSGWLTLEHASARMVFTFRSGKLVAARSDDASQRLGQQLVALGLLDETKLEAVLDVQRETNPTSAFGTLVVSLGLVSPEQLQSALTAQFGELVFRLIVRPTGTFRFDPGVPDMHGEPVNVSVEREIFEAVRRADEWCAAHIRSSMLSLNPAISAETSRLTSANDRVIIRALMRGPRSYRDLIGATGKNPEAVLEILTRLQTNGVIFIEDAIQHELTPQTRPALVA